MDNPRTHYLQGLLQAFGTGFMSGEVGEVGEGTGKERSKRGLNQATLRRRRKAQRQARKKGRK